MTRVKEMQRLIRHYREVTGTTDFNMHDVAKFAASKGWPLPSPVDPLDRLAKDFSEAARQEIRHDKKTGQPYRGYHARTEVRGNEQLTLWVDIDEAPRRPMLKCLIQKREQIVGEGLQITRDADHWNSIHPDEEPIQIPMDFTDDIEWRKNAPSEKAS